MADIALVTADKIELIESIQQLTLVAGEAITAGESVRINTSGQWENADASSSGVADAYGMALHTVVAGQAVTAVRRGKVDGFDVSGVAYWAKLYLSDTDNTGVLGTTAGTVSVVVARVIPVTGTGPGNNPDKVILLEYNS